MSGLEQCNSGPVSGETFVRCRTQRLVTWVWTKHGQIQVTAEAFNSFPGRDSSCRRLGLDRNFSKFSTPLLRLAGIEWPELRPLLLFVKIGEGWQEKHGWGGETCNGFNSLNLAYPPNQQWAGAGEKVCAGLKVASMQPLQLIVEIRW